MVARGNPAGAARTLVVWCPDWPLTAAGAAAGVPAAVIVDDRVLACSRAAREDGVRRGVHRREAQRRSPEIALLPHDPRRDAAAFEGVVAVVEGFAPAVEVVRPGLCAFRSAGPSRYLGGRSPAVPEVEADTELAARVTAAVGHGCQVGVADGLFAAGLAARHAAVVPPDGTARFLAPLPVGVLDRPELVDLLTRLGVRTLGDLAALPAADVLARFGPQGAGAHRLARGLDERPLDIRPPAPELTVEASLEPPADRVDRAAFAAKALADRLHERLAAHRTACTRVAIEAETEHGERMTRLWRHDGAMGPSAIAERVRWQLDGWINGTGGVAGRPSGGITLLRITADEVTPDDGNQLDVWGTTDDGDERAVRAIARVQGMLGPHAVTTAVPDGGRGPDDRVEWVTWGEPRRPVREPDAPWPGHLPPPHPALVHADPLPARVTDGDGAPVTVTGRCAVSAPPAWLAVGGAPPLRAVAWAGPWPVDERWWDPAGRRRARLQVVTADGAAWLLGLEGGRWQVEATYD